MDLEKIYEKHDHEKERFNALRDKVWADMKERHNNIIAAFQTKENMPEGYAEKMEKEIEGFQGDWSVPNGKYYRNMILQHEQQIDEITRSFEPANNISQSKDYTSSFIDKLASSKEFDKEAQRDEGMDKLKSFEKNKEDMDLDQP